MVDLLCGSREKGLGFNSVLTPVPLFQPGSTLQPLALCGFGFCVCFKVSSAKWLDSHSQPLLWHLICLLFPAICNSMVQLPNLTDSCALSPFLPHCFTLLPCACLYYSFSSGKPPSFKRKLHSSVTRPSSELPGAGRTEQESQTADLTFEVGFHGKQVQPRVLSC